MPVNKKSPGGTGALYAMEMAEPLLGDDAHERVLLDALLPKLYTARDLRKQRVVGARAHVDAGPIDGAALAHEDIAGQHLLAAELLDAEPFRLGFAAVLGTAACLFVCHCALSLENRRLSRRCW